MSKLIRAAQTSQSLSLAAMEEASRFGLRKADIEHLFLALAISDQSAGRTLRDLGITIHSARVAVKEQHDEQLASLGLNSAFPEGERIVFHETDGYEWTARATNLLAKSAGKGKSGDADAVLRELLAEPSGLIHDILGRLGTSPDAVLNMLTKPAISAAATMPAASRVKDHNTGSIEAFVSAPIEQVWALLSDPTRVPEWDTTIGTVEHNGEDPVPGTTWEGTSVTTYPDGQRSKIKPQFRRRSIELVSADYPQKVSWSLGLPDAEGHNPVLTTFTLLESTGGTQVQIARSWSRSKGWRKIVAMPLRPIQKFLLWIGLFQTGSAISRTFR